MKKQLKRLRMRNLRLFGLALSNNRLFFPIFQPEVSWNYTVVSVLKSVPITPVVECTVCHTEPGKKTWDTDPGTVRPMQDEINHGIPHFSRCCRIFHISPRLFFNATYSSISSDKTSFLVCSLASRAKVFRFVFCLPFPAFCWKARKPFSKNVFCQR